MVFVDQVSAAIPVFLLLSRSKVCRVFPYATFTTPIWEQPGILGVTCTISRSAFRFHMRQQGAAVLNRGSCACTCAVMPAPFSLGEAFTCRQDMVCYVQVLFYCHFPDLLLAQKRSGIRAIYRWPLDAIEELTTGQAHQILVNSRYTQGEFAFCAVRRRPSASEDTETAFCVDLQLARLMV